MGFNSGLKGLNQVKLLITAFIPLLLSRTTEFEAFILSLDSGKSKTEGRRKSYAVISSQHHTEKLLSLTLTKQQLR
jgi:hypothetical protein